MRLVVDHHHVRHGHEFWHYPLQHLPLRFERIGRLARAPLKQLAAAFGKVDALTQLECVEVGDNDDGTVQVINHIARDQLSISVVALGVVREQDTQPVANRQAWRDDQKAARKARVRLSKALTEGDGGHMRSSSLFLCHAISCTSRRVEVARFAVSTYR